MTGMVFLHIIKWKEIELAQKVTSTSAKKKSKKPRKKKADTSSSLILDSIRNRPIVLDETNKFLSFH